VQPQAVQPTAPAAPPPPSPPAPAPQTVVKPAPLVYRRAPVRVQPRKTEPNQNPRRKKVSKPAAERTLPRPRTEVVTESSSRDHMLLIGGLALVVLIIGDTVFLSLSARFLRA
jgi:hypothetical protein